MKKQEKALLRLQIPDHSRSYYKEIGEKAAVYTFTRPKLKHKLSSLSPRAMVKAETEVRGYTRKDLLKSPSPDGGKGKRVGLVYEELAKIQKNESKIAFNLSIRDVSHIKDATSKANKSNETSSIKFFDLPLDIELVKKNLINPENIDEMFKKSGVSYKLLSPELSSPGHDKSEVLEIDRLLLGNPSGRQETENLGKWIEKMKETWASGNLDSNENLSAIYLLAAKEMVRQVSVHCAQRGEVLNEILKFFVGNLKFAKESIKIVEKNTKKMKQVVFEDFKKRESVLIDKVKNLEDSVSFLSDRIEEKIKKISELNERILLDSEIIEDLKLRFEYETENSCRGLKVIQKSSKGLKTQRNPQFFSKFPQTQHNYLQYDRASQTDPGPAFPSTSAKACQAKPTLMVSPSGLGIEIVSPSYKYSEPSPDTLYPNSPAGDHVEFKRGSSKSFNSSAQAYRQRTKKSIMSPINELVRKIKEKDKHIAMLESLIENQKEFIEVKEVKEAKEVIEEKRQSFPKITFHPAEEIPNFDLASFQTGFKSGFDNGYNLGFKDVQDESNSSVSEQLDKSDEIFTKLREEDSFEKEIERDREVIRANTIAVDPDKNSETSANYSLIESFNDEIQVKQRKVRKSVIKTNFLLNPDLTSNLKLKSSVIPLTQIVQFNFTRRLYKDPKKSLSVKILDRVLEKKISWFKKRAYLSKKMINKLMFSFYLSYFSKSDFQEPFIYFIYEELAQKSGLKSVGDRKFIHFLSSLIVLHPLKRPTNFIKFLGAGSIINNPNFLPFSLRYFLECLHFMNSSKIGICTVDETSDKIMLPVSRAVECVKEKLEKIDKAAIGKTISLIESQGEPDPKKINKTGVVECELVLEVLLAVFEEFQVRVIDGVELIINALKYEEDKSFLYKSEVLLILRTFCADNVERFESYWLGDEILIEDFCGFCVQQFILTGNDIKTCVPFPPLSSTELIPVINNTLDENKSSLKSLKASEKLARFWNYKTLKQKLRNIESSLHRREVYECLLASEIYKLEINRIKLL